MIMRIGQVVRGKKNTLTKSERFVVWRRIDMSFKAKVKEYCSVRNRNIDELIRKWLSISIGED